MHEAVSRPNLVRYGLLAMPLAFAGIPLYIHAPDFYVTTYNISLSSIGLLLLILRFVDAIQDPIIGRLSDRFSAYRLPIMLGAAVMLVAGFTALFYPLSENKLLWFAATILLATSAYSILSVNLNSIGGLWSDNYHHKTRITSYREAFGLLGLLIAVILPSVLHTTMPRTEAFIWVSLTLAGLLSITLWLFIPWYHAHRRQITQPTGEAEGFWRLLTHLPLSSRRFFTIYGISMLASAIPAVLILFFVRDRLGAESYTGLFLALYFIAGAASMPLWQIVSKRRNKAIAWLASMVLAIASFIWAFFLGEGDIIAFGIICLLSGMAFGADLAIPPSILSDVIQEHRQRNVTALYFSFMSFLLKSAAGIAAAMVFFLLDITGLNPGGENTSATLWWLSIAYALIPCVIKLFSAGLLFASLSHFTQGDPNEKNSYPHRSTTHAH